MEQSNSLLLNEEALKQCVDAKRPIFIYEWLRYLDRILPVTEKVGFSFDTGDTHLICTSIAKPLHGIFV